MAEVAPDAAGEMQGPRTPQRGATRQRRLSTTPLRTPGSAPRSAHRDDLARDQRLLQRLRENDPELTTLWLADGELEEEALADLLAGLGQNTVLKRLYLHGKCLTTDAVEELVHVLLENHGASSCSSGRRACTFVPDESCLRRLCD